MSEVFCERLYQVVVDGAPVSFPVRWMKPEQGELQGHPIWLCRFEIDWPHLPPLRSRVFGEDGVQALLLAMEGVAFMLYDAKPPVFLWEPDDILRLPVSSTFADLDARRTRR